MIDFTRVSFGSAQDKLPMKLNKEKMLGSKNPFNPFHPPKSPFRQIILPALLLPVNFEIQNVLQSGISIRQRAASATTFHRQ